MEQPPAGNRQRRFRGKSRRIQRDSFGNIANLLQGRVAGLDITNLSGAPVAVTWLLP